MACPFIQNTEGRPRRALCNQVEGNGPIVACWWLCTSSSRPHEQGSLKGVLAERPVIAPGTGRDKDWSCCKGVSCPYLVGDCHKAISQPSPVWGRTALPSSLFPSSRATTAFCGKLEHRCSALRSDFYMAEYSTYHSGGLSLGSLGPLPSCGTRM